jgi:hypothetical protein
VGPTGQPLFRWMPCPDWLAWAVPSHRCACGHESPILIAGPSRRCFSPASRQRRSEAAPVWAMFHHRLKPLSKAPCHRPHPSTLTSPFSLPAGCRCWAVPSRSRRHILPHRCLKLYCWWGSCSAHHCAFELLESPPTLLALLHRLPTWSHRWPAPRACASALGCVARSRVRADALGYRAVGPWGHGPRVCTVQVGCWHCVDGPLFCFPIFWINLNLLQNSKFCTSLIWS